MKDGKMCIGMVGCGQIMPSTAKGILASQHCIIDAVMDIDADAAKEKGEMYAVPYYTDLWEFLSRPEMDVVYIAVRTLCTCPSASKPRAPASTLSSKSRWPRPSRTQKCSWRNAAKPV